MHFPYRKKRSAVYAKDNISSAYLKEGTHVDTYNVMYNYEVTETKRRKRKVKKQKHGSKLGQMNQTVYSVVMIWEREGKTVQGIERIM